MEAKDYKVSFAVENTFSCEFNSRMFTVEDDNHVAFSRTDEHGVFDSGKGLLCIDLNLNKFSFEYDIFNIQGKVLSTKKVGNSFKFEVATDFFHTFIYAMDTGDNGVSL